MSNSQFFQNDPEIFQAILKEQQRQLEGIELIPSENYASKAVMEANGSILTNKYAEGYPGIRYYGGCENVDEIEQIAINRLKNLFKAEHANVQPHSGAPANLAVYFALLKPGDTILGLDLSHGGHLTHGHPITHIANLFNFIRYKTNSKGEIDYEQIKDLAKKHKPKLLLVGYSAYSHDINYQLIKEIADKNNCITMADIAHISGLIAANEMNNPVPIFDVVTSTTHKTLRGPRGGIIMCKQPFAKIIDRSVFPSLQGGPHMNNIAAKAVAFKEAATPEFKQYAKQIKSNAKSMEKKLKELGYKIIFGGTSNHLLLIDIIGSKNLSGKIAQNTLDYVGITTNKNMIPDDTRSPFDPSGIRIGTPAITTRGFKENDCEKVIDFLDTALTNYSSPEKLEKLKEEIKNFAIQFPLP